MSDIYSSNYDNGNEPANYAEILARHNTTAPTVYKKPGKTGGVKKQNRRIKTLESRCQEHESRIAALEAESCDLYNLICNLESELDQQHLILMQLSSRPGFTNFFAKIFPSIASITTAFIGRKSHSRPQHRPLYLADRNNKK